MTLLGKIMCYAIVAVAMDLIWGYAGILSLGHGLFFAARRLRFRMYLMRQIGSDGPVPPSRCRTSWCPRLEGISLAMVETPIRSGGARMLVIVVPGLLAFVFGYFAFRSRVKGVYFSIITQALTFAAMLLFFRNATGFGGNNGFTDFRRILDIPIATPQTRMVLFRRHRRDADRHAAARALADDFALRPRAGGDPRRRAARHVLRLRQRCITSSSCGRVSR